MSKYLTTLFTSQGYGRDQVKLWVEMDDEN